MGRIWRWWEMSPLTIAWASVRKWCRHYVYHPETLAELRHPLPQIMELSECFSRKGPQPKTASPPKFTSQGSHNPMPGQHCPLLQFGTSHLSFRGCSSFSWNLCCNCFRVLMSLSIFILLPSLLYRTELLGKPFVRRSLPPSLFPVDLNLNKQQTLQEDQLL